MQLTPPEQVGLSTTRLQRITTTMQRYIDERKTAGIVSLVARRGQVVHLEAVGYQDLTTYRPLQTDTIFRIYSMTKPITSVALMMLYEEGLFQLADPVSRFIPAFKNVKVYVKSDFTGLKLTAPDRPITIHDLLRHTAGLSYGFHEDSPIEELYRQIRLARFDVPMGELVQQVASLPLLYQPGTCWRYSVATDVVGHLVEIISGLPLDVFFRERIFQPLGMTETDFHVPPEKAHRLATLYTFDSNHVLHPLDTPPYTTRYLTPPITFAGGAGLTSTLTDYLRFAQMLLNKGQLEGVRLLSRKTIELMSMNHLTPDLLPISMGSRYLAGYGFGLGFRVSVDVAQTGILGSLGEFGWSGAASTYFWIDPREELLGILMTQLIPSEGNPFARSLKVLTYQAIID